MIIRITLISLAMIHQTLPVLAGETKPEWQQAIEKYVSEGCAASKLALQICTALMTRETKAQMAQGSKTVCASPFASHPLIAAARRKLEKNFGTTPTENPEPCIQLADLIAENSGKVMEFAGLQKEGRHIEFGRSAKPDNPSRKVGVGSRSDAKPTVVDGKTHNESESATRINRIALSSNNVKRAVAVKSKSDAKLTAGDSKTLNELESAAWLDRIASALERKTDLQKNSYLASLAGQKIRVTIEVADVMEGSFWAGNFTDIVIKSGPLTGDMYVFCIMKNKRFAVGLNRGDRVTCEGRVKKVSNAGFWLQTDVVADSVKMAR